MIVIGSGWSHSKPANVWLSTADGANRDPLFAAPAAAACRRVVVDAVNSTIRCNMAMIWARSLMLSSPRVPTRWVVGASLVCATLSHGGWTHLLFARRQPGHPQALGSSAGRSTSWLAACDRCDRQRCRGRIPPRLSLYDDMPTCPVAVRHLGAHIVCTFVASVSAADLQQQQFTQHFVVIMCALCKKTVVIQQLQC